MSDIQYHQVCQLAHIDTNQQKRIAELEAENAALVKLKNAAQGVVANQWIHHGTFCVAEGPLKALAKALGQESNDE